MASGHRGLGGLVYGLGLHVKWGGFQRGLEPRGSLTWLRFSKLKIMGWVACQDQVGGFVVIQVSRLFSWISGSDEKWSDSGYALKVGP